MGGVIAAAKAQCQALVRRLRFLVPQFRAGLVTYDDGARLRVPLTVDAAELQKGLDKVAASGGGDVEEGVDKGIYLALKQEQVGWSRKAHRIIVIVGDAPPARGRRRSRCSGASRSPPTTKCSTTPSPSTASPPAAEGVRHFGPIAAAGAATTSRSAGTDRLGEELVLLTFGAKFRTLAEAWLEEVDRIRAAEPNPR